MEYFKILVVHRQAVLLEKVKLILDRFKPNLQLYGCGIDGLQAAKLEHFDLILCGTCLPLITGFEMVRAIRNLSRNYMTPVIFIADNLVPEHEALSRQLGGLCIIGSRNLGPNLSYVVENIATFHKMPPTVIQNN